jgi:cellulose synthase/poly-beta-1,6-N-acetylglucosamine synthase-like glycosyltransferase
LNLNTVLYVFNLLFLVYFIIINGFYLTLIIISARVVNRHSRVIAMTHYNGAFATTFFKPVTVLVPGYNEEATIVHTVESAISVRYPELEVVVINDGSKDKTLDILIEAYDLVLLEGEVPNQIRCKPIRGVYESRRVPGLRVVDKENGGKADALNAGINVATFPLVCNVDADSLIDVKAMVSISRPFLEDHRVVAVGGVVMPANDCIIADGEVKKVRLARHPLARFQIVEYLRAFLFGRVGWARINSLMIVSGAFAIFRKTALIEVGGYRTDTVGEDMELILRMHRTFYDLKRPYKILFLPDPICWTQVPEDIKSLAKQRRRWQRGLAESLWKNRQLCFNPKYGEVGMIGFPFFLMCELLSPAIELAGYLIVIWAVLVHAIDWKLAIAYLSVAIFLGTILSMSSLLLEAKSLRKYVNLRDTMILCLFALLESFGYRQAHSVWRVLGLKDHLLKKRGWGQPTRKAF